MKRKLALLLAVVLTCTWICAGAEAPATGTDNFTYSKAVDNMTKVEEVKVETTITNGSVPPETNINFQIIETTKSETVTQEVNKIVDFLGSLIKKPEPTATLEPGATPTPTPTATPTLEPGATPAPTATPEPPQEIANIIEYFPEEVKQAVQEMLPEDVSTETLIGTEAIGVTIEKYEESYGHMTAQFTFASVYQDEQPVVVLMGIIVGDHTEWIPVPAIAKNGGVEITFSPESLVRLQGKDALLVVLTPEEYYATLKNSNMSPEAIGTPVDEFGTPLTD